MSEKHKPGTVAMVSAVGTDPEVRLLQHPRSGGGGGKWMGAKGFVYDDESVTTVRPLVVLDLEGTPLGGTNPAMWLRNFRELVRDLPANEWTHRVALLDHIADQIEAQTKPPEPEEVGPLVEFSADGRQYFVTTFLRKDFMAAESDVKRLQLAEMVVQNGRVIKNRRGGVA